MLFSRKIKLVTVKGSDAAFDHTTIWLYNALVPDEYIKSERYVNTYSEAYRVTEIRKISKRKARKLLKRYNQKMALKVPPVNNPKFLYKSSFANS